MRKEFELSQEDLDSLLNASKPVPAMYLSGGQLMGGTPQENANRVWKEMGKKYGFVWDTAQPVTSKSQRFITAEETNYLRLLSGGKTCRQVGGAKCRK